MTETEFWLFLKQSIAVNGRMDMVSGCIDGNNGEISRNGSYLSGHAVLFNGHEKISENKIKDIGNLLFDPMVSNRAKEAI